jgi:protoporphyrinogen oxidase
LDDEFTFNRISEQKAMSEKMVPRGKTVLCVEKNCDFNDSIWNASAEQHFAKAMEELEEANLVSREEVEGYDVAKVRYAYPVFEVDFQNRLDSVMRYLAGVERLITVGRSGLYLNNDMHDSMEMGLMAGRYVLRCLNQEQTSRPWYEEVSAYKYAKGW